MWFLSPGFHLLWIITHLVFLKHDSPRIKSSNYAFSESKSLTSPISHNVCCLEKRKLQDLHSNTFAALLDKEEN